MYVLSKINYLGIFISILSHHLIINYRVLNIFLHFEKLTLFPTLTRLKILTNYLQQKVIWRQIKIFINKLLTAGL